jgi:hypothetical protein
MVRFPFGHDSAFSAKSGEKDGASASWKSLKVGPPTSFLNLERAANDARNSAGGPSGLILAGWVFCLLLTTYCFLFPFREFLGYQSFFALHFFPDIPPKLRYP